MEGEGAKNVKQKDRYCQCVPTRILFFCVTVQINNNMDIVVVEPTLDDQFDKFYLAPPAISSGGAHFTRLLYNISNGRPTPRPTPVFLNVPQCTSKQGCVRSGKRCYMDLVLSHTDTVFVQWIEHMETRCQELLFEKGKAWFETTLDRADIDAAFTTPLKIYRSGKFYLMRVNVPPEITVFDENNQLLKLDDLTPSTPFMSILEVRGIKFSAAAFQMEFDLRQIMVVQPNPFLNTCFLKQSVLDAARPEAAAVAVATEMPKLAASVIAVESTDGGSGSGTGEEDDDLDLDDFIKGSAAALAVQKEAPAQPAYADADEVDLNSLLGGGDEGDAANSSFENNNNDVDDMAEMDVDALVFESDVGGAGSGGGQPLKLKNYRATAATAAALAAERAGRELYEQAKQAALEAIQLVREAEANARALCAEADEMREQYRIRDDAPARL